MNICLLSTGYPPENGGGIGTYTYNLANALVNLGHNVHVITKSDVNRKSCENVNGVIVHRIPFLSFPYIIERFLPGMRWSFYIYKYIKKINKGCEFDIIEFPNWEAPGLITQIFLSNIPVIVRMHTPYFETLEIDKKSKSKTIEDRMICAFEKISCLKATSLVSSTAFHAEKMSREYSLDEKEINIIPLGIIDTVKKYIDHNNNNTFNILYVSRLEHRKGTLTLIDSLPHILHDKSNVRVNFVGQDRPHAPGDITFEEYFKKEYKELEKFVVFSGYVSDEDLENFYKNANIFIVPSKYESFGLIYIEAMKYSLPSISTFGGGIPEVIENGVNGYLIEEDNKDHLISIFNKLYNDRALLRKLSVSARDTYEKKFDAVNMAKNTENLYMNCTKS